MFENLGSAGHNTSRIVLLTSSALVACAASYALIHYMSNRKGKARVIPKPEKWVPVGKISRLTIYPVKTCQGVEVQEGKLTPIGLQGSGPNAKFLRDRCFLIVNSKGAFQTQRQFPQLALVHVQITDDDKLILSAPEKGSAGSVTCDLNRMSDSKQTIRIWTDYIPAKNIKDLGDEVSAWISDFLEQPGFRIVYYSSDRSGRAMTSVYKKFDLFSPEDTGSFQDDTSYMLMTEKSIDAVNTKLEGRETVSYKNFRPTILVNEVSEPFAEDGWAFVRFGNAENGPILKAAMPCQRCRETTVNPDTGVFNPQGEPLKTIQAMKRHIMDEKTTKLVKGVLGIHLGLYEGKDAIIRGGDTVYMGVK